MIYTVYKVTNIKNGHCYVGKHRTENPLDSYMGSGRLINAAIRKHGRENFKKEILFECLTEEEMNQRESEIVTKEFCKRSDTYNMHEGGYGGFFHLNDGGKNHIERAKKAGKISWEKNLKDNPNTRFKEKNTIWIGRKHSEEAKSKMSQTKKGRPAHNKGKPMSEEQKGKLRAFYANKRLTNNEKNDINTLSDVDNCS